MMMLSSTEAVSSAKANNIVANLRNIKTATLAWYADHFDKVEEINKNKKNFQHDTTVINGIKQYLSNGDAIKLNKNGGKEVTKGTYAVFNGNPERTTWFVGYRFLDSENSVKEKVRAKAGLLPIHFASKWPNPQGKDPTDKNLETKDSVWMYILGDFSDQGSGWKDK